MNKLNCRFPALLTFTPLAASLRMTVGESRPAPVGIFAGVPVISPAVSRGQWRLLL
jgi:hypothetical protein